MTKSVRRSRLRLMRRVRDNAPHPWLAYLDSLPAEKRADAIAQGEVLGRRIAGALGEGPVRRAMKARA